MIKSSIAAVAALAFLPSLASAATVNFGDVTEAPSTTTATVATHTTTIMTFGIDQPMLVDLTIAMTGRYADLILSSRVTLTYKGVATDIFFTPSRAGGSLGYAATLFEAIFDDDFTLTFYGGNQRNIGVTVTGVGEILEVPVVPLPASALLLAGGLGALGVLRRRKPRG